MPSADPGRSGAGPAVMGVCVGRAGAPDAEEDDDDDEVVAGWLVLTAEAAGAAGAEELAGAALAAGELAAGAAEPQAARSVAPRPVMAMWRAARRLIWMGAGVDSTVPRDALG